jgi:hypothetical protein
MTSDPDVPRDLSPSQTAAGDTVPADNASHPSPAADERGDGPPLAHPARPVRATAPRLSWEGLVALGCVVLTALLLAIDAHYVGQTKHVICDKWLARGQADCASGDGFREWFPAVVKQGVLLLVAEIIVVPLAVYGFARIFSDSQAGRSEA